MKTRWSFFLISTLFASTLIGFTSAAAASAPKALTTCTTVSTGAVRILLAGTCSNTEMKIVWTRSTRVGASGAKTLCTNIKTGVSRVLPKGACIPKTELKSVWIPKYIYPLPKPSSTATATPTALSCAAGGKCVRKDVGPGGGLVFYVADAPQPWGRYLEVAPTNWNGPGGDPRAPWCNITDTLIATTFEFGAGAANSSTLASTCATSAAAVARAYRGGGKSDWYLPSINELNELHGFVYGLDIPGFAADYYWSSTQDGYLNAWGVYFIKGGTLVAAKTSVYLVRPIRRF